MRLLGNSVTVMCVSALFAAASSAPSSSAQAQKRDPPIFESGVSLVAIPVFVTDKNGKSIAGLTAADFEVEDSGKAVPIAGFEEIDLDVAASPQSQARFADLPLAVQAEGRRQFVLLVDFQFLPPSHAKASDMVQRARKAAASFLRNTLVPGDLVAVVSIDGRNGLKVLCGFTTDHEAAARLAEAKSPGITPSVDPLGLSGNSVAFLGERAAEELKNEGDGAKAANEAEAGHGIDGFLDDLAALIKRLAPFRGRKQVVWMSNGFSEDALKERGGIAQKLFQQALDADVVFHAVSLDGIPLANASNSNLEDPHVTNAPPPDWFKQRSAPSSVDRGGRDTLATVASNTGGRFIMPGNDFNLLFALRKPSPTSLRVRLAAVTRTTSRSVRQRRTDPRRGAIENHRH